MIPLGLNKALASVSPGPQSPAPLPSWAGCSIPLPRGQLSYTHVLHKWTQQTIKEPIALCWQLILGQSWQLGITKSLLVLWPWLCGSQSGAGHSHTLLLCSNSSVLRAIASGHAIFSILGLDLPATALQSRWKAELGASPHRLSPPLRAGPSRDTKTTASICVRASPEGFGAGSGQRCCSQSSRDWLITMGGTKPRANSFPRMWLWRKLYLGKCSGHSLPDTGHGNTWLL